MHSQLRLLFVEDNPDLAANLCDYFEEKGHSVDYAMDGITGMHMAVVNSYDVIVLDVMLPGIDGIALCQSLRKNALRDTPIIMLTARHSLDDKVAGFNSGADDYLVKPFEIKELELRIHSLHKRSNGTVTRNVLRVADLEFNLETMTAHRGDHPLKLQAVTLRILELLMRRSPAVIPRQEIEHAIWGDSPPDSNSLRVHMHTLRAAIDKPGLPTLLHTLHRIGYRLSPPSTHSDTPIT